MIGRHVGTARGLWLVAAACLASVLIGCGGGGAGGAGTTQSPAGPVSGASPAAVASSPAATPSSTVSAPDLAEAKRVVERLIAAVNEDRFALARSLMVDPDRWWSLDDMKAIRSIRLERVALTGVEGADSMLLQTDLERDPPPQAGGPSWPNFMLLVREPSGSWRVAETATGP
jgi:hypothetical protein